MLWFVKRRWRYSFYQLGPDRAQSLVVDLASHFSSCLLICPFKFLLLAVGAVQSINNMRAKEVELGYDKIWNIGDE